MGRDGTTSDRLSRKALKRSSELTPEHEKKPVVEKAWERTPDSGNNEELGVLRKLKGVQEG